MALKRSKRSIERSDNPFLSLNLENLTKILNSLRDQEFYYTKEHLYCKNTAPLWLAPAHPPASKEESALINPAFWEKWKPISSEATGSSYNITGIQMVFRHFFTDKYKYLYIQREIMEYGEDTVMWLSDVNGSLGTHILTSGLNKHYGTTPPLFAPILESCKAAFSPNEFHRVDRRHLTVSHGSLSCTLFDWGYRQTGMGSWHRLDEDDSAEQFSGEQITAWVGEFRKKNLCSEACEYLYIVLRRHMFEENAYDDGGQLRNLYTESQITMYAARCATPAEQVCWIPFEMTSVEDLPNSEAITDYLEDCHRLDLLLQSHTLQHNTLQHMSIGQLN